jgi:hypothetical protein
LHDDQSPAETKQGAAWPAQADCRLPLEKSTADAALREIRRLINTLPTGEVALYVEEVDLHVNPKIGADWMLPCDRRVVAASSFSR